MKTKSLKNKTIDLSVEDGKEYLDRCVLIKDVSGVPLNKTVRGDTFAVMEKLPDNFADLIIVDPPYNLGKNFHGNKFGATSDSDYEAYTLSWLKPVIRLLKDGGTLYVCCDWKSGVVIGKCLSELLTVKNRITWQREKGRGAAKNWKNSLEDIWYCVKGDNFKFNLEKVKIRRKVLAPYKVDGKPKDWMETEDGKFRDTCPSNFWDDISVPYWSMPENTEHPTQKPEKLIAKLILASSDEGDIVFDPFLGSGTTSVVAKKLNRNYVGIEQNARYCVWAEKRLQIADTVKAIQGYDGKRFFERNTKIKP